MGFWPFGKTEINRTNTITYIKNMDPVKTQYSKLLNNGPTTSSHQHGSGPTITAALDVSKWMPGADWMATVSIIIKPMVRRNIFLIYPRLLGLGHHPATEPWTSPGKTGFSSITSWISWSWCDSPRGAKNFRSGCLLHVLGSVWTCSKTWRTSETKTVTMETCQASWCLSHHSAKDIKQTHTTSYRVGLRKLGPTKTEFGCPITRWFVDSQKKTSSTASSPITLW